MNTKGVEDGIGDEQVVTEIYADACCWAGWGDNPSVFRIWSERLPGTEIDKSINIGTGSTPELAWADARSKLPAAVPEDKPTFAYSLAMAISVNSGWIDAAKVQAAIELFMYQNHWEAKR